MKKRDKTPYLSYSGFTKYETCPQQYYQEYVLGQRPEIEDARNFFTGQALHKVLEDYLLHGVDDPTWIMDNAEPYWHAEVEKQPFIDWRHENDAEELLQKMRKWSISLATLVNQANISGSEWTPEFKADSNVEIKGKLVRLGGRIDLMRKKSNGDVIFLDLKASENRSIMKLDQITWYSLLLGIYLKDLSLPTAGGYILPGFNELKLYRVSNEEKKALLLRIHAAFEGIEQGIWAPKPEKSKCFRCNVKHLCPAMPGPDPRLSGIVDLGA